MKMNSEHGFSIEFSQAAAALGRYANSEDNAKGICALAGLPPGSRILDVACGTGRYAVALWRLGHHVTALDLSDEQIAYARKHNPGPHYLVADMRDPPPGHFDLIINTYSSFGYLDSEDEDQKALRAWRRHLSTSGALLMEVSDLERVRARFGSDRRQVIQAYDDCSESYEMDWETNVLTIVHDLRGVGSVTCRRRVYSTEHIVEMLKRAGFAMVDVYGSFQGGQKRPTDRSVLLALLAR